MSSRPPMENLVEVVNLTHPLPRVGYTINIVNFHQCLWNRIDVLRFRFRFRFRHRKVSGSRSRQYVLSTVLQQKLYKILPFQFYKQNCFPESWPLIFIFDYYTLFYVGSLSKSVPEPRPGCVPVLLTALRQKVAVPLVPVPAPVPGSTTLFSSPVTTNLMACTAHKLQK